MSRQQTPGLERTILVAAVGGSLIAFHSASLPLLRETQLTVGAACVVAAVLAAALDLSIKRTAEAEVSEPPPLPDGRKQYVDSSSRGLGFGLTAIDKYGETLVYSRRTDGAVEGVAHLGSEADLRAALSGLEVHSLGDPDWVAFTATEWSHDR